MIITNQLPQYTPNIDAHITRESPRCYIFPLDTTLAILTQVTKSCITTLCTTPSPPHHYPMHPMPRRWPHTHWMIGTLVLTRGYCHDSVYDTLFLALTPTQAIAGLTLTSYPNKRPTTRDPSSDLCLPHYLSLSPFAHDSFLMSHPLSIITNSRHHGEPHGTYLPFLLARRIQDIHLYSDTLTYQLVIGW